MTCVKDKNGVDLEEDRDIEEAFRSEWSKIFQISDEENEEFDSDHEEEISNWVNANIHRTQPYEKVDFNRLRDTGKITEPEFYHFLRTF